jgi:hypothetical protein
MKAYSAKWPKAFVLFFAVTNCSVALVLAGLTAAAEGLFLEDWLIAGASVRALS